MKENKKCIIVKEKMKNLNNIIKRKWRIRTIKKFYYKIFVNLLKGRGGVILG